MDGVAAGAHDQLQVCADGATPVVHQLHPDLLQRLPVDHWLQVNTYIPDRGEICDYLITNDAVRCASVPRFLLRSGGGR